MPKEKPRTKSSSLYDHNARRVVARQLNISRGSTGRSSHCSYTSSQVSLKPLPQSHNDSNTGHELHHAAYAGMDIDADLPDHMVNPEANTAEGAEQPVKVMPDITKPTEKHYENSVSLP
jgi:hypothetical protein